MKPKHPNLTPECRSISELLARIGDKWTVLVVGLLGDGPQRFSALRKMIYGISQKMLTTTLRSLERDGFVVRTVFPTTPPSVSYELTELGRDLLVPVGALAKWATANQARVDVAREKFDRINGRLDRPPLEPARAAKGNGATDSARQGENDLAADVARLT